MLAEAELELAEHTLASPVPGWVEALDVAPGETAGAFVPVARVVDLDRLAVDFSLSSGRFHSWTAKAGETLRVGFAGERGAAVEEETVYGRIVAISRLADRPTDTFRITLELDNPGRRGAGEHVRVYID